MYSVARDRNLSKASSSGTTGMERRRSRSGSIEGLRRIIPSMTALMALRISPDTPP
ncbi:MAG: hypothetical protein IKP53_02775 [Candidatus Methanomethylophilaceae archaeon]|nr:hypothetical protein [Candidatus Methanomethylophilaceae archaeon]MBR7006405.1 hypothetical protein [Candidatus Methanomethylophilaceae archaeon]